MAKIRKRKINIYLNDFKKYQKEIEDIVCDDNLYFKLPELLSNHNEIILLIEIIWKVFLIEYQTLYSIPNLPTYESVYELHKFIWVMWDMQEERGLKWKELNLPNF